MVVGFKEVTTAKNHLKSARHSKFKEQQPAKVEMPVLQNPRDLGPATPPNSIFSTSSFLYLVHQELPQGSLTCHKLCSFAMVYWSTSLCRLKPESTAGLTTDRLLVLENQFTSGQSAICCAALAASKLARPVPGLFF